MIIIIIRVILGLHEKLAMDPKMRFGNKTKF
jgi:hypothetical protein